MPDNSASTRGPLAKEIAETLLGHYVVIGTSRDPEDTVIIGPDSRACGLIQKMEIKFDVNVPGETRLVMVRARPVEESEPSRFETLRREFPDTFVSYETSPAPPEMQEVVSHIERLEVRNPVVLMAPDRNVAAALTIIFSRRPSVAP